MKRHIFSVVVFIGGVLSGCASNPYENCTFSVEEEKRGCYQEQADKSSECLKALSGLATTNPNNKFIGGVVLFSFIDEVIELLDKIFGKSTYKAQSVCKAEYSLCDDNYQAGMQRCRYAY